MDLLLPFRRAALFDGLSADLRQLPLIQEAGPGALIGVIRGFQGSSEPDRHPFDSLAPGFSRIDENGSLSGCDFEDLPRALYSQASLAYTMARADRQIARLAESYARSFPDGARPALFEAHVLRDAVILDDSDFSVHPDVENVRDAADKVLRSIHVVLAEDLSNHALLATIESVQAFLEMRLLQNTSISSAPGRLPDRLGVRLCPETSPGNADPLS